MAFLNASGFGFFPVSIPYTSLKYLFIPTFSNLLYCISLYQFVSATISYFLSRNFSILIVLSTLFVKQHVIVDVLGAFVISTILFINNYKINKINHKKYVAKIVEKC